MELIKIFFIDWRTTFYLRLFWVQHGFHY